MSDLNYVIGNHGQTTATASYPTIIQSATITTSGFPVQITVSGDGAANNAGWQDIQIFRGATAIGGILHVESGATGSSVIVAMNKIDLPVAGTYTYSVRVVNGSGVGITYTEFDQLSMIVEEKIISSYFANNWLRRDITPPSVYYGYSTDYTAVDSDSKWSIKKVSVSGTVESVSWANGNPKSNNSIWNDRVDCFSIPVDPIGLTGSYITIDSYPILRFNWTKISGVESYKVVVSDSITGDIFTDGGYVLHNSGYNNMFTNEVFNLDTYDYKNPQLGKSYNVSVIASNVSGEVVETINILSYNTPTNTTPPSITGATSVGQILTTTDGIWLGDVNIGYSITYTYQWYRGATAISGATLSTYTLVSSDAGETVKCNVTANSAYGTASSYSNLLTIDWETIATPTGFNVTPPFTIQSKGTDYRVSPSFNLLSYADIVETKTYYVDSVNGLDTNTGLSWGQAFKTLSKIQSQGDADLVYIAENSYFQKNQRSTQYTRNIKFIGLGSGSTRPRITADINNQTGTFSVHSGNCYKANITEFCGYAYDKSNINAFGKETALTAAASIAACIATPNTFFTDWPNTDVYVNLYNGRVPDANLILGDALSMAITADNRKQYFENIIFGSIQIYNSTSAGGLKVYLKNCLFGATVFGVTEFIMQDCITYSRGGDCINYDVRNTIGTVAYEINCDIMTQNLGTSNTQASTSHNGCTIVRIGGNYHNTGGQNVADVIAGQTWMLGSELYESVSGVGCYFDISKVWLDGVYIHDNAIGIQIQGTCQGRYRNLRNLATTPTEVGVNAQFIAY